MEYYSSELLFAVFYYGLLFFLCAAVAFGIFWMCRQVLYRINHKTTRKSTIVGLFLGIMVTVLGYWLIFISPEAIHCGVGLSSRGLLSFLIFLPAYPLIFIFSWHEWFVPSLCRHSMVQIILLLSLNIFFYAYLLGMLHSAWLKIERK